MSKCPINGKPCSKYKPYHITEKVSGKVENYIVCEDCLYNKTSNLNLSNEDLTCVCGTKLNEILKGGRIGCAKCYEVFKDYIYQIVSVVQNIKDPKHVGSAPYLWKWQQAENTSCAEFVDEIKLKIKELADKEDYKKAQKLKKQLDSFQEIEIKFLKADEEQAPCVKKELVQFIYEFRELDLT